MTEMQFQQLAWLENTLATRDQKKLAKEVT